MNPTTVPNTNGTPASAVEYVRALSPEAKQAVFLALLREVLAMNGDTGVFPVNDEEGKPFGYYVPPKTAAALAEQEVPKLSPEREQELTDRFGRLHTAVPISQVIADLKEQAARAQTPQS